MDQTQADSIIESYENLRDKCYNLARQNDGALMGNDAWLRHALNDTDMRLTASADGIECSGYTFTSQTSYSEPFDFTIPYDLLED